MPTTVNLPSGRTVELPDDPEGRALVMSDLQREINKEQIEQQKVVSPKLVGALAFLLFALVAVGAAGGVAIGVGTLAYRWIVGLGG